MMKAGTVPVPHTTAAFSDDDVFPVLGVYCIWVRHSGGGETPRER